MKKGTNLYRQQSERSQFQNTSASFGEFIEGLQLEVVVEQLSSAEYERAAQLTQRTNQFNTSGVRRNAAELASLLGSGERCARAVRVKDRFGDYGLVGLASFFFAGDKLNVDSLLMSCRVLGKGVEHQVVALLGREALSRGLSEVVIHFRATDRNQPAETFLKSVGGSSCQDGSFHFSAIEAAGVAFDPDRWVRPESAQEKLETITHGSTLPDFLTIAAELDSVDKILQAVLRHFQRARPQLPNQMVQPRSSHEARVARIWADVLHIDAVGVTDCSLPLAASRCKRQALFRAYRTNSRRACRSARFSRIRLSLNLPGSSISRRQGVTLPCQRRRRHSFPRRRNACGFLTSSSPTARLTTSR